MIFTETSLAGAFMIDIQKLEDDRGFFARSFCQHEFTQHQLEPIFVQCNISYNQVKGTLRGMHYQKPPFEEAKLVRCARGAIYDVIVDLRPESGSFLGWFGCELNERNYRMLYVPKGFAHGFITLADHTEIFYQMSEFYAPDYANGFRWNDPLVHIDWPITAKCISAKDSSYPDLDQESFLHTPPNQR